MSKHIACAVCALALLGGCKHASPLEPCVIEVHVRVIPQNDTIVFGEFRENDSCKILRGDTIR